MDINAAGKAIKNYLNYAKQTDMRLYDAIVQRIRRNTSPADFAQAMNMGDISDFFATAMNTIITEGPKIADTLLKSRVAVAQNNAQVAIVKAQAAQATAATQAANQMPFYVGSQPRLTGYDAQGKPIYSSGVTGSSMGSVGIILGIVAIGGIGFYMLTKRPAGRKR